MKKITFIWASMFLLLFTAITSTFAISPTSDCGTNGSQQITVNNNNCNTTSFDFSSSIGSPSLSGTCASGGTQDGWGWFNANGTSTTVSATPSGSNPRNIALMIYTGTCGSLSLVTCINASSGSGTESVTFTSVNGVNYFIRVVRMSGTSNSSENDVCVTNNVPPVISGFSPSSGCVGSTLTINGTNLNNATSVKIGGTNAAIISNSSTVITATVGSGTTGIVSVTSSGGTANGSGTFTVNQLPVLYTVSGGGAYCPGDAGMPVNLSNSEVGVSYQLKLGASNSGSPVSGTGGAFSFGNQTSTGTYTVVATTGAGCGRTMSGNAAVSTNTNAGISSQPPNRTICENANTSFSVTANGTGPYSYQWQDNSTGSMADISGATNSSFSVSGASLGMSGRQYHVLVTGACGPVVTSNTVSLTVNPIPVVSVSPTPSNAMVCGTGSVTLAASGATTYSWTPGGSSSASISVSPLTTTNYTVTGTTTGCSSTATQSVTVNPAVTALASASLTTLCEGGNSALAAAGGNTTNYNITSIPYSGPLGSGSSAVSGDDVVSGSVTIPFTFSYYGINYNNLYVYTNGFVQLGSSSNSTTVYGQTLPSASNPNNIIAGVLSDLNASSNTISTFTTGSSPNRVFSIYYNNVQFYCSGTSGGCSSNKRGNANFQIRLYENSNIIEVHLQNVANSSTTSGSLKSCGLENANGTSAKVPTGRNGSDGNWMVSTPEAWRFTPGGGTLTYSWSPTTYLTDETISDPTAQNMLLSQNYIVTVTDQNGCTDVSQAAAITVNPLPNVTITPAGPTAFCAGGNVTLTAPAGMSSYSWNTTPVQTTQSIVVNTQAGYIVTGTNSNGCSNTATQVITVYDTLPAAIIVIGNSNLCTGQTTTDLLAFQSNAVSYLWNTSSGTDLITVSTSGIYSVSVTDNHGCLHNQSQAITESSAPVAPIIQALGSIVLCSDGITTTSVVLSTTNYSSDLLWSTSETTPDITADYGDNFIVTYTDANGCYSSSNTITTEVRDFSLDPSSALNNSSYGEICSGSPASLTVNGGALAVDATWVWYEGACGNGIAVASGTSAAPIPTGGGMHHYYVRAEGYCNVTNCVPVSVRVRTSVPLSTVNVNSAPASACTGNTAAISVSTVSNASYYSWSGPSGVLFDGVAGPYQTTATGVVTTFGSLPSGSGYSICAFAGNACGQSGTICKWVRAKLTTPGAISGSTTGCPNTNSIYSVDPVAGADTYTWTVSGNDATLNGTSLSTTTTSTPNVSVDFAAPFTVATLQVYASLSCGYNSASRSLAISRNPAAPGTMSGISYVCPQGSAMYSISPVNGAASYNWSCSVPGAIISPAGNTANIFFPTTIPGGSVVCVTALSGCGYPSITRCKGIATGIPNTPANIIGPALGQCGENGVSYSIPPVNSATSYQWNVSNGNASIVGPNNLSSIAVDFTGSLNNVQLSVYAINNCGVSVTRTLSVFGKPGNPSAIQGNNSVCNGSVESYTTGGSAGATTLTWVVPNTATILGGQGSANILVLWGSSGGQLKVIAVNDCGSSSYVILPVNVTCRQSQISNTFESDVKIYPNPAHDKMKVEISSLISDRANIELINTIGEIVYRSELKINEGTNVIELNLENMAKGFYNLSVKGSSINAQQRIVIE